MTYIDVIVAENENRIENLIDDYEMSVYFMSMNVIESSLTASSFVQDFDEQQDQQKFNELKE